MQNCAVTKSRWKCWTRCCALCSLLHLPSTRRTIHFFRVVGDADAFEWRDTCTKFTISLMAIYCEHFSATHSHSHSHIRLLHIYRIDRKTIPNLAVVWRRMPKTGGCRESVACKTYTTMVLVSETFAANKWIRKSYDNRLDCSARSYHWLTEWVNNWIARLRLCV